MKLHHIFSVFLFGVAAWTAAPAELAAQGTQTLVEKVRFCTSGLICFGHTQSEYRAWDDNNVAPEKQKRTFISRYVEPSRSAVEHLVFLSAGQRDDLGHSQSNLLTGQVANFATSFSSTDEEEWETIDTRSIAYRLFSEGHRDPADTFAGLAFDARFNLMFTAGNKDEIADAYYDWLRSKFYSSNLKSVYLAGHSRGGALVLHLAERFRQDFPETPLIVHLFDPVLNESQGELDVESGKLANPFNAGFESYEFDFSRLFPNQNRLLVYNFVSGDPVSFLGIPLAYSAAHRTGLGAQAPFFDLGWFIQDYTTLGHVGIAKSAGLVNNALDHLELSGDPLIQAYCDSRPPQVRCNVNPQFSFGDFTTATFDALGTTSQSGAPLVSYSWDFLGSSIQVGTAPSGTGPGPHSVSFWRVGNSSDITGFVTVTDGYGNTASASCTSTVQASGDCPEFEFCLEPGL